jgi:alcohol dehydrogenase class IV
LIRFSARTEVLISGDLGRDVLAIQAEERFSHAGVIMDGNVAENRLVGDLLADLGEVAEVTPMVTRSLEPTTGLVDEVAAFFRPEGIDFFIGIGGGSTIDLTKAVSAMVVNPGSVELYHGTGRPIQGAVRKMMIPTTAGTGSEVTPGAVLVNERTKFKRGLSSPGISPEYALLHAPLTVTMPDPVTASTGLDALGHAIESFTSKSANGITRMYSLEAFRLVAANLGKVFANPSDLAIRTNLLVGANLAGFAIHNSNTGAAHSLAYPLGIYHKVPHGVGVGLVLPRVVRINVGKGCSQYAQLYDALEGRDPGIQDPMEKSREFCRFLSRHEALKHLGKGVRDFGITGENAGFLAERGLDLKPALESNPVEFTLEDSRRVFQALLGGA